MQGVNALTYNEFILAQLKTYPAGEPIYTGHISAALAQQYTLPPKDASAATAVAFKRILEAKHDPMLRAYQKGIYYHTAKTPFGEVGINKERLIADKYLLPNNGYETGLSVLYSLGLTTQMARERCLATNRARSCVRTDKKLGVVVRPPKTKITKENKTYLQVLDALELMDKAPIDVEHPYAILAKHIQTQGLRYDRLLSLADQFYNTRTILQLAHTAVCVTG